MDDVLNKAIVRREMLAQDMVRIKNKIADLDGDLKRLQAQHDKIDYWIETYRELEQSDPSAGGELPLGTPANSAPYKATPRPKNPSREVVADMAVDMIREAGRPLSRREIFDGLADRGIKIHGKDPEMVLSTMLWREPNSVHRLPRFGYWLTHEPYGPANYAPPAPAT